MALLKATLLAPIRFEGFELDLRTGELRRDGTPVRLQPQPAKVLALLVSRAGEVVTRDELVRHVWGADTFVDFDKGLTFAIRQIRTALEDNAEQPKFLETLPKRGYRFVARVEVPASEIPAIEERPTAEVLPQTHKQVFRYGVSAAVLVAIALGLIIVWRHFGAPKLRAAGPAITSVAVLPLRNLSRDAEQEYFSDGMTDELITELAKVGNLRVISHTSVGRYKDTQERLPDIARELGVEAVVEGTVMRSGDRIRITAQLIDARTDRHLWAEKYERDFRETLTLQSEIAQQIAAEIGVNLTMADRARLIRTQVVDPVAYEAYLRGRFFWDKLRCSGFRQALNYYEQAGAKDPTFARAFVGIAETEYNLADWGCEPQMETFGKSKAAALKAIGLDPTLASAYAQLAALDFAPEWDWPKAEREYLHAVSLDANDAGTHRSYAIFLVAMGRREQALAEMRKAYELDPVSETTNMLGAYVLYCAHRYDEAIAQGQKTLELYPNSGATHYWMGHIYEQKGMAQEAFDSYLKSNRGTPAEFAALHAAFEKGGLRGFWLQQFKTSKNKPDWPCWKAMLYGHTGDNEHAMQMLAQSFDYHCDGLQFLKTNPLFDSLHDDPRYQELISKLKL
jgi:TolB-like protein/DNA-binding winged helix-turn-helix (wHTH) protein